MKFIRIVMTDDERAAWCRRHGAKPFDGRCPTCKAPARVDVPARYNGATCLTADPCACGETQMPRSDGSEYEAAIRWALDQCRAEIVARMREGQPKKWRLT